MQSIINKFIYKIYCCFLLLILINVTISAVASIVNTGQKKLTDADIYKQAMHEVLIDYKFLVSATATYNYKDEIGAAKIPLTLLRAKSISENSDILISNAYTKSILKNIEPNTKTNFFIKGLLSSANTKNHTGEITDRLNTNIKKVINNSTSDYSFLVNKINIDLYDIAKVAYLAESNSLLFDSLIEYVDLSDIINDINEQREEIINNIPIKSEILKEFLKNKISVKLPKIKRLDRIPLPKEYTKKIIDNIEENINHKLNLDFKNLYKDTKKLLLHIYNIQKLIQTNNNNLNITDYLIPNTHVSTSANTMNIIEMVEGNIKKRLLHIQNVSKEITVNNMWFQSGYLYSENRNDLIIGKYTSKVKGISIGIEDNSKEYYDMCIGFCYSYVKSYTQSNKINKVWVDTTNYIFSSYVSLIYKRFIYDLQFNYIKSANNRQRTDILGYNYLTAYNNHAIALEFTAGKKFQLENNLIVNCKISCNLSRNDTSTYKEQSVAIDYHVSPRANTKVSVGAEATLHGSMYIYGIRINPEFVANIKYDVLKNEKIHDVTLYQYKSTIKILEKNKISAKLGIGLLSNIKSFNIRLDYFFKINSNLKTHMVNGNLSYYF